MTTSDKALLRRLGTGETISALCADVGLSREEFDRWWQRTAAARVPRADGTLNAPLRSSARIDRDRLGIPHIVAGCDEDLFFCFGYAMAQDRLFQLDYLRRKGLGRLAEILGPAGVESDTVSRTVGLNRIARAEWGGLPAETRTLLEAFAAGINALIDHSGDNLPIEFDLLDYRPEPWSPIDSLAIESEFRWYLTGRFPIIVMPELAKRTLGEGALYHDYLRGEDDDEAMLLPGMYPARKEPGEPVGQATGDPDASTGSNNWVVAARKSATGRPMVGSDPHIAFEAVSCWYEVHLAGGSFNVAGMAYAGIPGLMIGRNPRVAWGITNNICSQRDLYQEQTSGEHPGRFLYDGQWEPARELTETIAVKGGEPLTKTIRFSRNGPIVDEILPAPGNATGPVSLKWLGAHQGGWLTALLGSNRADGVQAFRESLRPWHVPTFNLVIADVDGHIAMQSTGRVPIRKVRERGYRPGWDPQHQWAGLIPFESMPHVVDPERGWMATANHRVAADDYPYPLSGCWSSGHRGRRIRQLIESREKLSRDDFRDMHQDSVSLRAVECVPPLLELLESAEGQGLRAKGQKDEVREPRDEGGLSGSQHSALLFQQTGPQPIPNLDHIQQAAGILRAWDCRCEPESVGPTLFNVFFTTWVRKVAQERFDPVAVELMSKGCEGVASRLLSADPHGWFQQGDRQAKIVEAMRQTIDFLSGRFGPDMSGWTWSRLHRLPLKHVLSSRGDLGELLNHGGEAVRGDITTVCNTGAGPDWIAATGAGYRMITDLAHQPAGLFAIDGQSESGHVGSPHYRDQFDDWRAGRYHFIPLDAATAAKEAVETLRLVPRE